jgi:hypothetical protein
MVAFGIKTPAPCPALRIENGQSRCEIMLMEAKHEDELPEGFKRFVRDGLKAGQGCTMEDYWLEKYADDLPGKRTTL